MVSHRAPDGACSGVHEARVVHIYGWHRAQHTLGWLQAGWPRSAVDWCLDHGMGGGTWMDRAWTANSGVGMLQRLCTRDAVMETCTHTAGNPGKGVLGPWGTTAVNTHTHAHTHIYIHSLPQNMCTHRATHAHPPCNTCAPAVQHMSTCRAPRGIHPLHLCAAARA